MSDIVDRLLKPVRFGWETQEQSRCRHFNERKEAATEIETLRQQLVQQTEFLHVAGDVNARLAGEIASLKSAAAKRFIELHETADKLAVAEQRVAELSKAKSICQMIADELPKTMGSLNKKMLLADIQEVYDLVNKDQVTKLTAALELAEKALKAWETLDLDEQQCDLALAAIREALNGEGK